MIQRNTHDKIVLNLIKNGKIKTDIENVGKQIYKNSIIYYGFIEYYNSILGRKNE